MSKQRNYDQTQMAKGEKVQTTKSEKSCCNKNNSYCVPNMPQQEHLKEPVEDTEMTIQHGPIGTFQINHPDTRILDRADTETLLELIDADTESTIETRSILKSKRGDSKAVTEQDSKKLSSLLQKKILMSPPDRLSSAAWFDKNNLEEVAATLPSEFKFEEDDAMDIVTGGSAEGDPKTSAMEMLTKDKSNNSDDMLYIKTSTTACAQQFPLSSIKNNTENMNTLTTKTENFSNISAKRSHINMERLSSSAWCNANEGFASVPRDFKFNEAGGEEGDPETSAFCALSVDDSLYTTMSTDDNVANTIPSVASLTGSTKHKRQKQQQPEYTDKDVLLGRGGMTNKHPGNKRFRKEVENLKQWYKECGSKREKKKLSELMVDWVHSYGGRFLSKDENDDEKWVIANPQAARRKASQALREAKWKTTLPQNENGNASA